MPINELTRQIIGAAIEVHRALGPGLLESAYEKRNRGRWQLCKLIQALGPHTEGIDYTEEQKGFLLDGGVLALGRCHLIRFELLSDYE